MKYTISKVIICFFLMLLVASISAGRFIQPSVEELHSMLSDQQTSYSQPDNSAFTNDGNNNDYAEVSSGASEIIAEGENENAVAENVISEDEFVYDPMAFWGEYYSNGTNPFDIDTVMRVDDWGYYVIELFRGAKIEELSVELEYTTSFRICDSKMISFQIRYPRVAETSPIADWFNDYYVNKLYADREKEENHLIYGRDFGFPMHGISYKLSAWLHAYSWGNVLSVIISEDVSWNRAYSTPLCDNFDLATGKRLTLDDLFVVDYDTYSVRLSESLIVPETDYKQSLFPYFHESGEYSGRIIDVPLPDLENFMLTPNGLAFIYYKGEISSMSAGTIILIVEYEDIYDILNVELIFGN